MLSSQEKTELTQGPEIPFLDICLEEWKTSPRRGICMPVFTEELWSIMNRCTNNTFTL